MNHHLIIIVAYLPHNVKKNIQKNAEIRII